jgi:anti-anti-sigma factor
MLHIVVEQSMDSALLRCSGRLVAGDEVLRLREAVMCQSDKRSVHLDLAGVEAIDAAGLGLLVSLHTLGYVVGFGLQVQNPVPWVRTLLKLTRLDSVLDIHPPNEGELTDPRLEVEGCINA